MSIVPELKLTEPSLFNMYKRLYMTRKSWKVTGYDFCDHIAPFAGIVVIHYDAASSDEAWNGHGADADVLRGPEAVEEDNGAVEGARHQRVQYRIEKEHWHDYAGTTWEDSFLCGHRWVVEQGDFQKIMYEGYNRFYSSRKIWKRHMLEVIRYHMNECGVDLVMP